MSEFTVTETQFEALKIACETATNPEGCTYSSGCVIAKLCDFYRVSYPEEDSTGYSESNCADLPFPISLLQQLQIFWDCLTFQKQPPNEKMVEKMTEIVEVQKEIPQKDLTRSKAAV